METRECAMCHKELSPENPGLLCVICQEKVVYDRVPLKNIRKLNIKDMRHILGLDSEEQVKRLGRKGKLPPRVPAIKQWLWEDVVVRDWIRSGWKISHEVREIADSLTEMHGGAHKDKKTQKTRVGKKEDIVVRVFSGTDKNPIHEVQIIPNIDSEHH